MSQKTIALVIIFLLILSTVVLVSYFLVIQDQSQSLQYAPRENKSSDFTPNEYGSIEGCVNVQFSENVGREQVRSLLRQVKNLKIPEEFKRPEEFFHNFGVIPNGFLVPTVRIVVNRSLLDQTMTALKDDPNIVDVQLADSDNYDYSAYKEDAVYNSNPEVYVLFVDSMTLDQAYQLLVNTYHLSPLSDGKLRNSGIFFKDTTLRLEVEPGLEYSVVETLRLSPIVQDALQCPVSGPLHMNSQ